MVYSRELQDKELTFGVSGRLYKSNLLFYDHQSESLWSQLLGQAVTGPRAGMMLKVIPSSRVSWKLYRSKYPNGLVLSDDTGHKRDYRNDPYEGYYRVGTIWFPVGDVRKDLSPKERILGIETGGRAKAYPLALLGDKAGKLNDQVGERKIEIHLGSGGEVVEVVDQKGRAVPMIFAFWFAWQAFHPDTEVYTR